MRNATSREEVIVLMAHYARHANEAIRDELWQEMSDLVRRPKLPRVVVSSALSRMATHPGRETDVDLGGQMTLIGMPGEVVRFTGLPLGALRRQNEEHRWICAWEKERAEAHLDWDGEPVSSPQATTPAPSPRRRRLQ